MYLKCQAQTLFRGLLFINIYQQGHRMSASWVALAKFEAGFFEGWHGVESASLEEPDSKLGKN